MDVASQQLGAVTKQLEEVKRELECIVCLQYPRPHAVSVCRRGGHVVCIPCCDVIGSVCPLCKDPTQGQHNAFLQRLIFVSLINEVFSCKYAEAHRCGFEGNVNNIEDHERECARTSQVWCPRSICSNICDPRPACHFEGTLQAVLAHNQESECFKVLKPWTTYSDQTEACFIVLIDIPNEIYTESIGRRMCGDPVFLVNQFYPKEFTYFTMVRDSNGYWELMFVEGNHKKVDTSPLKKIIIEASILHPDSKNNLEVSCKVNPLTERQLSDNNYRGCHLVMHDRQVKDFSTNYGNQHSSSRTIGMKVNVTRVQEN